MGRASFFVNNDSQLDLAEHPSTMGDSSTTTDAHAQMLSARPKSPLPVPASAPSILGARAPSIKQSIRRSLRRPTKLMSIRRPSMAHSERRGTKATASKSFAGASEAEALVRAIRGPPTILWRETHTAPLEFVVPSQTVIVEHGDERDSVDHPDISHATSDMPSSLSSPTSDDSSPPFTPERPSAAHTRQSSSSSISSAATTTASSSGASPTSSAHGHPHPNRSARIVGDAFHSIEMFDQDFGDALGDADEEDIDDLSAFKKRVGWARDKRLAVKPGKAGALTLTWLNGVSEESIVDDGQDEEEVVVDDDDNSDNDAEAGHEVVDEGVPLPPLLDTSEAPLRRPPRNTARVIPTLIKPPRSATPPPPAIIIDDASADDHEHEAEEAVVEYERPGRRPSRPLPPLAHPSTLLVTRKPLLNERRTKAFSLDGGSAPIPRKAVRSRMSMLLDRP